MYGKKFFSNFAKILNPFESASFHMTTFAVSNADVHFVVVETE